MQERIARRCRELGMIYSEIAQGMGFSFSKARRLCDPQAKAKDNEYNLKHTAPANAMRYRILMRYKEQQGCCDCGYCAHGVALQFDHRPGTVKLNEVSKSMSIDFDKILNEIAKCDVRCANCHSIITHQRRTND
jgi:hypothetical protein